MKKLLTFLLLFFLIANINAQNAKIDSLRQLLTFLPDDTSKLKVYIELTDEFNSTDLKEALKTGIKGQEFASKVNNDNLLVRMRIALGRSYANNGLIDSAEHHFLIANDIVEKTGHLNNKGAVLTKLIYVADAKGDYKKASTLAFENIRIQEKLKNYREIAYCNIDISNANYGMNNYDEARKYAEIALRTFKENNFEEDQIHPLKELSLITLMLEENEKALEYANQAISIAKKYNQEIEIGLALNARGNIFKYMEKYEESLNDYKQGKKIFDKNKAYIFSEMIDRNIGHVYNLQGRYAEALPLHLASAKNIIEDGDKSNLYESYLHISDAYAGLNMHDSAFYYKTLQLETLEERYDDETESTLVKFQTEYETEKKELLINQQQSELTLKNTQQKYLMGIGGMLLMLLGGAFFAFRSKQKSNQALEEKNKEINMLFGEVHHRVKNNLQILSSLLHLQSRHITDDAALSAVKEGQNRVEAMGLIHQKLYTKDNASTIEISDYLNELGESLTDSLMGDDQVEISYDTPQLFLDVDTAIPLGLIVNELITNSLKYGFPDDRKGEIQVKLTIDVHNNLNLTVADNGIGKHAAKDLAGKNQTKKSTNFGTQLIRILCKKLKGNIKIVEQEVGYSTEISFSKWK